MGIIETYQELLDRQAAEQLRALTEGGMPQAPPDGETNETAEVTNDVLAQASAAFRDQTGS